MVAALKVFCFSNKIKITEIQICSTPTTTKNINKHDKVIYSGKIKVDIDKVLKGHCYFQLDELLIKAKNIIFYDLHSEI